MENTSNLYQRISAVMQNIEYLTKDDSVGSGSYAYKAISEEKVTQAVRASLVKNGLVILPVEQKLNLTDHIREQGKFVCISTVETKYKIVNIDNPTEFEYLVSGGHGVDPQDKGAGKAMTYSYKYLLLRTFAIPTGDDPDKVHNGDLDKQQGKALSKDKKTSPAAAMATKEQKEKAILILNAIVFTEKERQEIVAGFNSITEVEAGERLTKLEETLHKRRLKRAIEEIDGCTSLGCLKEIWAKYSDLQKQQGFIKATQEKKAALSAAPAPAPAEENTSRFASDKQRELISKLVDSSVFTEEEKSDFLDKIAVDEYPKEQAIKDIEWLTKEIATRKEALKQNAAPVPAGSQYASAKQKEQIIRLLNNPVITRQEKTKMLLNINKLSEEQAANTISSLKATIEEREAQDASL